jgi:hypothetical protein
MLEQELIAAEIGLWPVVTGKLPKYSDALINRAMRIQKEFRDVAKKFGEISKPLPMPEATILRKDYDKVVEGLNTEWDSDIVAENMAQWPDELYAMVEMQLLENRIYLQPQVPTQVPFGSFQMTLIEPSDSDKARFMWQANLVDRPQRFAELFLAGALTQVETALMRTLYPALFDVFLFALIDEIVAAAMDNKIASWEGGWKRLAMSNLLGVQVDSFQNVLAWQTGFEEKTAGRPPNPGRIELAEANQTDLQKTQAR